MDDSSTPRPTPRPPTTQPSVVADVEASLAALADLPAAEQVEVYRDLESSLRASLRTAGEDV